MQRFFTPAGGMNFLTSTTPTSASGACPPPGRQGPSKSTRTRRTSTRAVRAACPGRDRNSTVRLSPAPPLGQRRLQMPRRIGQASVLASADHEIHCLRLTEPKGS